MMTQTTSYDHPADKELIDCMEQGAEGDRYPVLHIGATVIWPTREQLIAIRDAINGYLDAHPIVITPAEIVKIAEIAPNVVAEFTDAEVREMF